MSLNTKLLNRQSHIALYYQLKHILLLQINEGVYKEGDRLPSESELSQQYEVSRHVVRQALKALIAEGRVIAYQGAGYFVNQKRIRKALPRLGSHTKSMASLGSPTQTLVVRQEVISPPEFITERLLPPEEDQAIYIERVSYLEDEPVCNISAYYPIKYADILLNFDLTNKSIYARLEDCCAIVPKRAETVVSVTFADEYQSSLLNIREGMPLLNIGSFTWSDIDELFEYSSGFYRIDRFELEFEQT
jgi:GntR family transcriptional regulator